jgi:hypothetical protein
LKVRERAPGDERPETESTFESIAAIYRYREENKKTLEFYKKLYEIIKKLLEKIVLDMYCKSAIL